MSLLAARAPQSGALTVVVSADGQELDRLPLAQFGTHTYANNGYTLTVTAAGGAVSVTQSDCPGQDCVHSGAVSRAGQSIVCLPARIVVELVGAADGYDLVPVDAGPTTFRTFLYVQQVARFAKGESLVGDVLTPPKKAAA